MRVTTSAASVTARTVQDLATERAGLELFAEGED